MCVFVSPAPCSCVSFNPETRRLSVGTDTGSICVSFPSKHNPLNYLPSVCFSRCFWDSCGLYFWLVIIVICLLTHTHTQWNAVRTVCILLKMLAAHQCSRMFLVSLFIHLEREFCQVTVSCRLLRKGNLWTVKFHLYSLGSVEVIRGRNNYNITRVING